MLNVKEFTKSPVAAIAVIALAAVGYLYVDVKSTMQGQIKQLQQEVKQLKAENKELQIQYIELAKNINR